VVESYFKETFSVFKMYKFHGVRKTEIFYCVSTFTIRLNSWTDVRQIKTEIFLAKHNDLSIVSLTHAAP